ncbi:hypothetical protein [Micrococcus sp. TA1]|uniref:hypothetical protein n=1 Tax=Micrococcus sp. TA1 TaxID=681627 RepID=UPI001613A8B7|nr:hypothetical protein [Micrococcus sp. TA1]MBB5749610.1 hypothetical protein [Micrococcus sp. TA1]
MTTEQEPTAPDGDPSGEDRDLEEAVSEELSPEEATPRLSKVLLFLGVLAAGAVMIVMVLFAMTLPTCEDPDRDWVPCIGP